MMPGVSQAAPAELGGARLRASTGVVLAEGQSPAFRAVAQSLAVEASWSFPAGSAHHWELGVRAEVWEPELRRHHELAFVAAAHVPLMRRPMVWEITPQLGGGIRGGVARDGGGELRAAFGPHVVLGFERSLGAFGSLALELSAHGLLSPPFRSTFSVGLSLFAVALP